MSVLLVSEHDHCKLSEQTARCLTAALQISSRVDILVVGKDTAYVAEAASRLEGVNKVIRVDNPLFEQQLAENLAMLVTSLAANYDSLIAPASTTWKSAMPRVAALLDVMQISEIVAVVDSDTFKRPIYAGNAIQTLQSTDKTKVITVRSSAFEPAAKAAENCPIEIKDGSWPDDRRSRFIANDFSQSERPELGSARIVISGGRALGSAEKFAQMILPVADRLGAAVGASRAAVDAGFAPNDWQVGQTGKIVAPDLYIACGISGAIQHLAGMKDSRTIVAINKDPEAPIFQIADYGLVGDLFEILPEFLRGLD